MSRRKEVTRSEDGVREGEGGDYRIDYQLERGDLLTAALFLYIINQCVRQ